jgi:hypothetical protein
LRQRFFLCNLFLSEKEKVERFPFPPFKSRFIASFVKKQILYPKRKNFRFSRKKNESFFDAIFAGILNVFQEKEGTINDIWAGNRRVLR